MRLADWGAEASLDRLVEAGCDRSKLVLRLVQIRRGIAKKPYSEEWLRNAAKKLQMASERLRMLADWDHACDLKLPEDAVRWLTTRSTDLEMLTDRLKDMPAANAEHKAYMDRATARIVRHVKAKTGLSCDADVAALIAAIQPHPPAQKDDNEADSPWKWRDAI